MIIAALLTISATVNAETANTTPDKRQILGTVWDQKSASLIAADKKQFPTLSAETTKYFKALAKDDQEIVIDHEFSKSDCFEKVKSTFRVIARNLQNNGFISDYNTPWIVEPSSYTMFNPISFLFKGNDFTITNNYNAEIKVPWVCKETSHKAYNIIFTIMGQTVNVSKQDLENM